MDLICSALRKNSHFLVTLNSLDLSYNKFDVETSNALASWISAPNSLKTLNVSNTNILFDRIADAFKRGCMTNLSYLDLSKNKFVNIDKLGEFIQVSQSLQV